MAKTLVMLLGIVFAVFGVLGFFSNPILGIFGVDSVLNVIHLVSGVLALVMASSGARSAKSFAKIFGLIYGIMAVAGLAMGTDGNILWLYSTNMAGVYLHLAIALVLSVVGMGKSGGSVSPIRPMSGTPM